MAALLVAMSIAAVLMTVAMPVWRQMAQREKEAELIFRGQQYARAIGLFQRKAGPGVLPPSVDILIEQRFLRKQYKDPMTGGDFEFLTPTTAPVAPTGSNSRTSGGGPSSASTRPATTFPSSADGAVGGRGGLTGVASKSKASSIRVYNGRTHYNEWQFVFVAQTNAPGQITDTANPGQAPGRNRPGTGFPTGQGLEPSPGSFGPGGGLNNMPPTGRGASPLQPVGRGAPSGQQPPPSRR